VVTALVGGEGTRLSEEELRRIAEVIDKARSSR
jgi:DNA-directed RNA polymerase subunit F